MSRSRGLVVLVLALAALGLAARPSFAAFPYARPGANTHDFSDLYLGAGETPNDLSGDVNEFKFAATPDPSNTLDNSNLVELGGVRGAHIDDASGAAQTAWMTTTGRPDVSIAVLDSGIKWNDGGAMNDLRLKIRINRGELPLPSHDLATAVSNPGRNDCSQFVSAYDANGDGVFNVDDYACDSRVATVLHGSGLRKGPAGVLTPEDLTIAFSDGVDGDGNGFVDDVAG